MANYLPTIGIEVHAELRTQTKMFCNSLNDPEEKRPNVNICPICMGHPGTLPVVNKEAVKHVLKVGLAFGSVLADFSEFDRKNYFYPDLAKGYQISQYKYPLVTGGRLAGVELTRIHLEEDTARSSHDEKLAGADATLLDFNRAGVPLMELVTEPVIHDAKTAGNFARELQLVLRYLGASEANMDKGQMRVEANISVSKDPKVFGTKVEVKNLNSFRSVERAIDYEVARQIELIESGGSVIQETRGWDESKQSTYSQRVKESAHDYRYFPDPDIPKFKLSEIPEFSEDALRREMPELPSEKRKRYAEVFGIKSADIDQIVMDPRLAEFFEAVTVKLAGKKEGVQVAANYLTSDVVGMAKSDSGDTSPGEAISRSRLSPDSFTELVAMVADGELSSRGAKDLLKRLYQDGGRPREIVTREGLGQKSDAGALGEVIEKIIASNEKVVSEYKGGKQASLQFLIGQAMKETKGSANPGVLKELFEKALT